MNKIKEKKFYDKQKCPNCGKYYNGYNGGYLYNEEFHCPSCVINLDEYKLPIFVQYYPGWAEGFNKHIYDFNNIEDLSKKFYFHKNQILVYQDNKLMIQTISGQAFWWVLGYVYNIDPKTFGIPEWTTEVYDKNKVVIPKKMEEWLKNKKLIYGEKNEYRINR